MSDLLSTCECLGTISITYEGLWGFPGCRLPLHTDTGLVRGHGFLQDGTGFVTRGTVLVFVKL